MLRSKGRHRTRVGRGSLRVLLFVAIGLIVITSGSAFAGYRYDKASADRILPGITVGGVDVGGMTRAQALDAVARQADEALHRKVRVVGGGSSFRIDPAALGATVDVAGAVSRAFSVSQEFSWPGRVFHRIMNRPVDRRFGIPVVLDDKRITAYVKKLAHNLFVSPTNASVDWVDGELALAKAKPGRALLQGRAEDAVRAALLGDAEQATLRFKPVSPKVTSDDLGKTIIVRTTTNELFLYDGVNLVKHYQVATGQAAYPTPLGHFTVINKRINPTWVNGAKDTWGADLPDYIPPGPDNPLGTRALDLSAPGIRIHGTPADYSIGTHASHGCIRMHIPESEELFDLVPVGTPVIIVP